MEKLNQIPSAFADAGEKINELVKAVHPFTNIEGRGGIKVIRSDNNVIVEIPSDGTGDKVSGTGAGLNPAGGTYEEFTICDSGTPASRWILTYTSNPSA